MKREVIADRGIWTAKKRYILNVYDSEGVRYEKPKLKMMGVETVKSSTPSSCRVALTESLNIIMNHSEERIQEHIKEFKKKFKTLPFEDISFPRSVQNVQYYSKETKAIPIAVRGAISFNKALKDYKLTKKYESIKDGEKIKYCYMKMPNPLQENILSIVSVLPKEFKMNAYIDYDLQFEKAFLDPLRSILNVIHWKEEPISSLENFF
jgi:DNA polymerase elongation subunit (family B)